MLFTGLYETRKWGMGKEGKILFQFILVIFPVCLVILQLGKDRAAGPVFVPMSTLFKCFCFSLVAFLKRSVCCHFPMLSTMCTTTGLNRDQVPLYLALCKHLQTAIQDWKNLKCLPTWMQIYLLPTNCEFKMVVVWFANTSPLSPRVGRSLFLAPNQPCQYYSLQIWGQYLLQSQVQESQRRSGLWILPLPGDCRRLFVDLNFRWVRCQPADSLNFLGGPLPSCLQETGYYIVPNSASTVWSGSD